MCHKRGFPIGYENSDLFKANDKNNYSSVQCLLENQLQTSSEVEHLPILFIYSIKTSCSEVSHKTENVVSHWLRGKKENYISR